MDLPEGAESVWIKSHGILQEGFTMPDGSVYIFDDDGIPSKVTVIESNKESEAPSVPENKPTYNVFSIVIGTILILVGLYFIYNGVMDISKYSGDSGRLASYIIGSRGVQQAQQNATYAILGGIIGAAFGVGFLANYRNKS